MSTRGRHSLEKKLKVVKEVLETGNAAIVARRYDLSSSMVSKWVRQYKQHGEAAFNGSSKGNGQVTGYTDKDYRKLEDENERLKKILGEKDLELYRHRGSSLFYARKILTGWYRSGDGLRR